MSAKKNGRRPTMSARNARAWRPPSKYHGVIVVKAPTDGVAITDDEEIVVAIRSIHFGTLPELGKSEVRLAMAVESGTPKTGSASTGTVKLESLRYIAKDSSLNIADLVVFQGKVQRFLTIRCSIDELDAADASKSAQIIAGLIGLLGSVVTGGPAKTVIGGLPTLISALMALNVDDQVLVLNHSFYVPPVGCVADRKLCSGIYTFEKVTGERETLPQVTLKLEVMRMAQ